MSLLNPHPKPEYNVTKAALKNTVALCGKLKLKRVSVINSRITATIENKLEIDSPSIVTINLGQALGPYISFDIPRTDINDRLRRIRNKTSTDLVLVDYTLANSNSVVANARVKTYEIIVPTDDAILLFDEDISKRPLINIPSLPSFAGARCLFNTPISKYHAILANIDHQKHFFDFYSKEGHLVMIAVTKEDGTLMKCLKLTDSISDNEADLIVRIPTFIASIIKNNFTVKCLKSIQDQYWIISEFTYKNITSTTFQQATVIKHTGYPRDTRAINDFLQYSLSKPEQKQ